MKCPECGCEIPAGNKFCTSCGAPLDEATTQMEQVPPAPAGGTAPGYPPALPPVKKKASKTVWIAMVAAVFGLCIIAAAIAIPLILSAANQPIAQITSIRLVRTDSDTLNTAKVPLDTELSFKVSYKARFKDSGSGWLQLFVVDSSDETVTDETYELTSSDKPQTKELKFTMEQGSGKPLHVRAKLTVNQGDRTLKAGKTLPFTMVSGKGAELQLEEATEAATKKCREATDTLKAAGAQGIDVTDLADRLSKALTDLENATTAAEANAVAQTAQGVIDECNARITAARDEQARNQDIAAAKQVMYNYANAEKGNAESIDLVDFSMNDQRTQANGTYMGLVTVHTDPDNAGQKDYFYVTAEKQNGQWVVTNFRYEFVQ